VLYVLCHFYCNCLQGDEEKGDEEKGEEEEEEEEEESEEEEEEEEGEEEGEEGEKVEMKCYISVDSFDPWNSICSVTDNVQKTQLLIDNSRYSTRFDFREF